MYLVLSYLIYFFILFFPVINFIIFYGLWRSNKFLFYIYSYFPIFIFAILRGNVGTDTENYRILYDDFFIENFTFISIDPLFNFLIYVCKSLNFDFQGFSFIQSLLCLFFYSFGAARVDRASPVFGVGLLPVLFIDSTFNGLRYGLALSISIVCISYYLKNNNNILRYIYILIPSLFHSSLGVLILLLPFWVIFGSSFIIYILIDLNNLVSNYFFLKIESYLDMQRNSLFSGLVPILSFLILYFMNYLNKEVAKSHLRFKFICIVFFIIGLFISYFSYAGLRIMQISVYLFSIFVSLNINDKNIKITTYLSIVLGLLLSINFSRQIFLMGAENGVFFHPYSFH